MLMVTLERTLDALKIVNDEENVDEVAYIENLIKTYSSFIARYCSINFPKKTITQQIKGNGQEMIPLLHYPATKIIKSPEYYKVNTSCIYLKEKLRKGEFYELVYEVGSDEAPLELQQVCLELVMNKYKTKGGIDLEMLKIEFITPNLKTILDSYKRFR